MHRNPVLIFLTLLLLNINVWGQVKTQSELDVIADKISEEALKLYRSEFTSWNGTDLFLAAYKESMDSLGGYFSYSTDSNYHCIFYSTSESPEVIGDVIFSNGYILSYTSTNLLKRPFTETERAYHLLKTRTSKLVKEDSLFRYYEGTNFNFIPLIEPGNVRVYAVTSSNKGGVAYLGNDYLIRFNDSLHVIAREKLHESLIKIERSSEPAGGGTIHTHLDEYSPFMTPTELCTIMLYKEIINMRSLVVVSRYYTVIWSGHETIHIFPAEKR
jgi:hypothetical protein